MASKRATARRLAPSLSYTLETDQTIIVRPAQISDPKAISPRLRQTDVDEIHALFGKNVNIAKKIAQSYHQSSICWTAEFDGVPELIFGAQDHSKKFAWIWMVGTEVIPTSFPKIFMRASRLIVDRWLLRYRPLLGNYVSEDNKPYLRWLNHLGARFIRRLPLGPYGKTFYEFVLCASPLPQRRQS